MLKKKFFKTAPTCDVTFQLPKGIEAGEASVVGEFNNWDPAAHPLKKVKGVWKTTVKLKKDHEYQYRYVVDGGEWHNDDAADKYVPNNVSGDNSVVVTSKN